MIFYFLLIIFVLFLIIVVIFSFPRFSPIPYFPSNKKDAPLILSALQLKNKQTVVDLGAGDGVVVFKAAYFAYQKALDTKFYAIEINPILLLILYVKRAFHPNRKNIYIVNADMFSMDYSFLVARKARHTTFYIYISPWYIDKTIANIKKKLKAFDVVSYFYQVKCLKHHKERVQKGVHMLYSYRK